MERMSLIACSGWEFISRMVCSRGSHLACMWQRIILGEIVGLRVDSWKGFQSSSVSCSPRPVSLKLSGTFLSGVGVCMERRGMEKGLEGFWSCRWGWGNRGWGSVTISLLGSFPPHMLAWVGTMVAMVMVILSKQVGRGTVWIGTVWTGGPWEPWWEAGAAWGTWRGIAYLCEWGDFGVPRLDVICTQAFLSSH